MLDRQQTVANVVLEHSECAPVFQRHRIDFCCRGNLSVESAAREKELDVDEFVAELSRAITDRHGERADDPRLLPTPKLVEHIVSRHHDYLRKALPFVRGLSAKVSRVHGDHDPRLRALDAAVSDLVSALLPHLEDEERALFPALLAPHVDRVALAAQFASMQREHLDVATLLERIRAASDGFALPDWACTSYRTLFAELEQLESDVFTHVHLENHALQPRFAPS